MTRALALVRRFAETHALEAEVVERLAVVVEEWVSNLIEHADLPAGARIGLGLALAGERIAVTVTDPGAPFDPRTATFDGPNLERGGGAGLALLHAWSRVDGYARRGGRNRLRLSLEIRPLETRRAAADLASPVG